MAGDEFRPEPPSEGDEEGLPPRGSLESFLSGGLPGFLDSPEDDDGWPMSDADLVEDEGALRAAEKAVAAIGDQVEASSGEASDEERVPAAPPAGVGYSWSAGPLGGDAAPDVAGARAPAPPVAVTGVGGPMSDNEMLAGMASGGSGKVAAILGVLAVVLVIGFALFAFLRG